MSFLKSLSKGISQAAKNIQATTKQVERVKQVIDESLEIYRTSQKHETRLSRLDVAILKFEYLIEEYPFWPENAEWKKQHAALVDEREDFFMPNLESLVAEFVVKIEEGKTARTKNNRAQKLIETLHKMRDDEDCDEDWVDTTIEELEQRYPAPPEK